MEDAQLLKILYTHNPWWESRKHQVPEKKRSEYGHLWQTMRDKQVTAIIGPRRVGKSVLMQQLIKQLIDENVNSKNIFSAQLDEPLFEMETNLLIARLLDIYSKYILKRDLADVSEKIYVFLDEIQHVEKWSETLKSYYDKGYPIKFVISGSSAAGITLGSSESLAGRISLNVVMTLSFIDYLRFREANSEFDDLTEGLHENFMLSVVKGDISLLSKALEEFLPRIIPKQGRIESLLSEYMIKGGYIELVNQADYSKCSQYLKDLLQLVIYKDLVKVFGIRNPKNIEDLLLYLSNHSAELSSEASISQKLGLKQETISEYLSYLEEVFFISRCLLYSTNRAKQLRNPRKVYISDTGIRNVLNGTYSPAALTDARDVGLMAETTAHNHIGRLSFQAGAYQSKCFYWKNGGEVDNVLVHGNKPMPVEVKYQNEIKAEDAKSCLAFMDENSSPFGIVITKNNLSFKEKIAYIPLWCFLLMC